MTIWWGKRRALRPLIAALSVIWKLPELHLVLLSPAHEHVGMGCIRATDTPRHMTKTNDGVMKMHYLPFPVTTSPQFLPTTAKAWNILGIQGFRVHGIPNREIGRINNPHPTKYSIFSEIRDHIIQIKHKKFHLMSDLLRSIRSRQNIKNRHKRKSHNPKRIGEVISRIENITEPEMRFNRDNSREISENTGKISQRQRGLETKNFKRSRKMIHPHRKWSDRYPKWYKVTDDHIRARNSGRTHITTFEDGRVSGCDEIMTLRPTYSSSVSKRREHLLGEDTPKRHLSDISPPPRAVSSNDLSESQRRNKITLTDTARSLGWEFSHIKIDSKGHIEESQTTDTMSQSEGEFKHKISLLSLPQFKVNRRDSEMGSVHNSSGENMGVTDHDHQKGLKTPLSQHTETTATNSPSEHSSSEFSSEDLLLELKRRSQKHDSKKGKVHTPEMEFPFAQRSQDDSKELSNTTRSNYKVKAKSISKGILNKDTSREIMSNPRMGELISRGILNKGTGDKIRNDTRIEKLPTHGILNKGTGSGMLKSISHGILNKGTIDHRDRDSISHRILNKDTSDEIRSDTQSNEVKAYKAGKDSSHTKEKTLVTRKKRSREKTIYHSKKKRCKVNTKSRKKRPHYSETRRYRLLQVYVKVRDRCGKILRVKAALDTQSNVSYAKEHLGKPRQWKPREGRIVKGLGGFCEETRPTITTFVKGNREVSIDTRTPPKNLFNDLEGPEILLSAQHCVDLRIDLNQALKSLEHRDVVYLAPNIKIERPNTKQHEVCMIAEKIMERYLQKSGGSDKEPKQCSIDDIVIAEDFTPAEKQRVKDICQKYREVFASNPDEIPPPMKDAEPHVFKMKRDVKPIYCKRPNWGPAQRRYLEQWTRKAIAQGLMEPAPDSQWASRPVLVGKYRGTTAKTDVPDGIRTCVDFTAVNEHIVKLPPQYTDPFEEIRKASGHTYYFEADGQKQFNSILLAEESRDVTTTWTPLGLMRWLRLIMGTKNASARAQQEYAKAMSRYLSEDDRNHIANFQDDFLGYEDTVSRLLSVFEGFLRMCLKAGITLNPAKIKVGFRKCKFYGFTLSKKGMEPAEKNLDPVKKMTPPKNRSEVRSVLGVFNQFRHFFPRYDRLVLHMTKLLKKNVVFTWSKEAQEGFEHIRKKLLQGDLYLAAQDRTKPLILETDGSDDGWGAILLQIVDGVRRVLKMWSKQWKTLHMRRELHHITKRQQRG